MISANGTLEVEVNGVAQSYPIIIEPPQNLLEQGGGAGVTASVGYSFPFGNGKVTMSVHLSCSQDQEIIQRAGEAAFTLARGIALEYMDKVAVDLGEGVGQTAHPRYDFARKD